MKPVAPILHGGRQVLSSSSLLVDVLWQMEFRVDLTPQDPPWLEASVRIEDPVPCLNIQETIFLVSPEYSQNEVTAYCLLEHQSVSTSMGVHIRLD